MSESATTDAVTLRAAGHTVAEDGSHDPEACYQCLLAREVSCSCNCGVCCRSLIIEVSLEDAVREPRIAQHGKPLKGYNDEPAGYLLNRGRGSADKAATYSHACVFLDEASGRCTIYATRPLVCRTFDCDGAGRHQLLRLGMLTPRAGETIPPEEDDYEDGYEDDQ